MGVISEVARRRRTRTAHVRGIHKVLARWVLAGNALAIPAEEAGSGPAGVGDRQAADAVLSVGRQCNPPRCSPGVTAPNICYTNMFQFS